MAVVQTWHTEWAAYQVASGKGLRMPGRSAQAAKGRFPLASAGIRPMATH